MASIFSTQDCAEEGSILTSSASALMLPSQVYLVDAPMLRRAPFSPPCARLRLLVLPSQVYLVDSPNAKVELESPPGGCSEAAR